MTLYISGADQISPAWLTEVLRQSGALQQGEVEAVEYQKTDAFNSDTFHLVLRYSGEVSPAPPTQLILKRNTSESWSREAGAEEVKFYMLVASLPDPPSAIIPCYAAAYDEASGNSYVLLLDLSATHRSPVTRDQQVSIEEGMPTVKDIEAVVDAMARLHAYWWEHSWLHTGTFPVGYWSRNADRFEQYLRRRTTAWRSLIADESEWFPDDLHDLYERLFARLPAYWEQHLAPRFRALKNLTLIHGDAYFANFLCPKDSVTGTTYWMDWQSPTLDLSSYDLVNLCATFWTSEQRHEGQREEKILRQYHAVLQVNGVSNYTWDDLLMDYRYGLIFWLSMPVQDRYGGSRKEYWWPKMQCLLAAFREWKCEELLDIR
ncbi:MAG: phosphotransferase [Candidatus Udaeobacter sp.]